MLEAIDAVITAEKTTTAKQNNALGKNVQCQTSTPQQCVHHNRIPPKVEYIELNRLLSTATQTSSRLDPHTKLFRVQRETASRCSKVGSRHKCRNNQMHATCFSPARPGKPVNDLANSKRTYFNTAQCSIRIVASHITDSVSITRTLVTTCVRRKGHSGDGSNDGRTKLAGFPAETSATA